jgi:hypothetical protein
MSDKKYAVEPVEIEVPAHTILRPPGPQIQRRERWVPLPQEYEGFKFRLWVNAPTKLWNALTAEANVPSGATEEEKAQIEKASEREKQQALAKIVLEHNGWLDFDGEPYPPASDAEAFWEAIPQELATTVLIACHVEMSVLPNSLLPKRRR